MKPRMYADTSVIGGIYDTEFKEWSERLIQEFKEGSKIIVLSDLTLREVEEAPENIKAVLEKIRLYNSINLKYGYPLIEIRSPREVLHEE